jgi:hypothetical protein
MFTEERTVGSSSSRPRQLARTATLHGCANQLLDGRVLVGAWHARFCELIPAL